MKKLELNLRKTGNGDSLYDMTNYLIMGFGVLMLVVGFILMSGGHQSGAEFNADEIYSTRRIVIAPFVVVVLGFGSLIYGVIRTPKKVEK